MSTSMERMRINIPSIGIFAASGKLVGLPHVLMRAMRWRLFQPRPRWVEGERCT